MCWRRIVLEGAKSLLVWFDDTITHTVTKYVDRCLRLHRLGFVEGKSSPLNCFMERLHMFIMFLLVSPATVMLPRYGKVSLSPSFLMSSLVFSRRRFRISGDAIPLMKESRTSSSRYCSAVTFLRLQFLLSFRSSWRNSVSVSPGFCLLVASR